MLDKNGGSFNHNSGGHNFYKQNLSEVLGIYIDET
jgi:hypothetical protein